MPTKVRCWSAVPRCSGCVTASACSPTQPRAKRSRESVDSTDGVVFVPALTGLGSPWWDADARGLIAGITRGTTKAHLVRAALEAIAHQVADVVDALPDPPSVLRADGGATGNAFLMQFQSGSARHSCRSCRRARDDRARGGGSRGRSRCPGRRRRRVRAESLPGCRGSTSSGLADGFEPISNLTRTS